MLILADESGDLGFDFCEKSPSKSFIITLLVCDDILIAKKVKIAVRKTLQKMNHKKSKSRLIHELKGSYTSLPVKQDFFGLMEKIEGWQLYSIILDKPEFIKTVGTPIDRSRLYSVLAHEVLKDINFSKSKTVSLLIDKSQNEKGIQNFNNYLRTSLNFIITVRLRTKHYP